MNHMTKNVRIIVSCFLLIIGFSSMGFSGYLYLQPLQEKTPEKVKAEAIKECKEAGTMLHYIPTGAGDSIIYRVEGLDNWKNNLTAMSIIISRCSGFEVRDFCMGTTCAKGNLVGTIMELKYYK